MRVSMEKMSTWKAKREKAIERLVAVWETYKEGDDPEKLNAATDAVALAHIALALDWADEPRQEWEEQKEKATNQLVAAWRKHDRNVENPETDESLNIALDALTIAHTATTFEWASGPLKW